MPCYVLLCIWGRKVTFQKKIGKRRKHAGGLCSCQCRAHFRSLQHKISGRYLTTRGKLCSRSMKAFRALPCRCRWRLRKWKPLWKPNNQAKGSSRRSSWHRSCWKQVCNPLWVAASKTKRRQMAAAWHLALLPKRWTSTSLWWASPDAWNCSWTWSIVSGPEVVFTSFRSLTSLRRNLLQPNLGFGCWKVCMTGCLTGWSKSVTSAKQCCKVTEHTVVLSHFLKRSKRLPD